MVRCSAVLCAHKGLITVYGHSNSLIAILREVQKQAAGQTMLIRKKITDKRLQHSADFFFALISLVYVLLDFVYTLVRYSL